MISLFKFEESFILVLGVLNDWFLANRWGNGPRRC